MIFNTCNNKIFHTMHGQFFCIILYLFLSRALVAEALEISTFMEKMNNSNENEQLRELAMGDWAK